MRGTVAVWATVCLSAWVRKDLEKDKRNGGDLLDFRVRKEK